MNRWCRQKSLHSNIFRIANCELALRAAETTLGVPSIVEAEHLASSALDELSWCAYLAYFVRKDGPIYLATLKRVQNVCLESLKCSQKKHILKVLDNTQIGDLSLSWCDGYLLGRLVSAAGGRVASLEEMIFENRIWNVRQGEQSRREFASRYLSSILALDAAEDLGIRSLLSAEEHADARLCNHIGWFFFFGCYLAFKYKLETSTMLGKNLTILLDMMALINSLCNRALDVRSDEAADADSTSDFEHFDAAAAVSEVEAASAATEETTPRVHTSCHVNQQLNLDLAFAANALLDENDLDVFVVGPNGDELVGAGELRVSRQRTEHGAVLSLVPTLVGTHTVSRRGESIEVVVDDSRTSNKFICKPNFKT